MKRFQILFLLCLALSFTFSIFAQDTKEVIILQTSDVHSRIEPINQCPPTRWKKAAQTSAI